MTLIDEARQHPKVEAIYQEVDAITPITVELTTDNFWSSSTLNGETIITVGKSSDPAAALMHELQHAKLKINGLRQYTSFSTINRRGLRIMDVVSALDNEIQHHRMFPEFIAAGFASEKFYNDDDLTIYRDIRRELRKMGPSDNVVAFMFMFISVIAPGGHGTCQERKELRNFLFTRCGQAKQAKLESIEREIKSWASAPLEEQSHLLRSILLKLDLSGVWIGSGSRFPEDGFFVGDAFTESSAYAFMKRMNLI